MKVKMKETKKEKTDEIKEKTWLTACRITSWILIIIGIILIGYGLWKRWFI